MRNDFDALDRAFMASGVTNNDIITKAYERTKAAVLKNPDIIIGETFGGALNEAAKWSKALKEQCGAAKESYIDDRDLKNAVACFNATLNMVKNTFGEENMTEAVICKAIEAGSYLGYRAIMGEAVSNGKRY